MEKITINGTSEKHGDYLILDVLVDGQVVCRMFGGMSATAALVLAKHLKIPEKKRDLHISEVADFYQK